MLPFALQSGNHSSGIRHSIFNFVSPYTKSRHSHEIRAISRHSTCPLSTNLALAPSSTVSPIRRRTAAFSSEFTAIRRRPFARARVFEPFRGIRLRVWQRQQPSRASFLPFATQRMPARTDESLTHRSLASSRLSSTSACFHPRSYSNGTEHRRARRFDHLLCHAPFFTILLYRCSPSGLSLFPAPCCPSASLFG